MPPENKSQRWNPWPVSIIAFFAVAIAGCISFVVFCSMNPIELVTSDYYERELRYQGEIEKLGRAHDLGGTANVGYSLATREIRIQLPEKHLTALSGGSIHLYRPSAAYLDQQLALQPDLQGRQAVDARELAPGLWRVRVQWSSGGKDYTLEEKLEI